MTQHIFSKSFFGFFYRYLFPDNKLSICEPYPIVFALEMLIIQKKLGL